MSRNSAFRRYNVLLTDITKKSAGCRGSFFQDIFLFRDILVYAAAVDLKCDGLCTAVFSDSAYCDFG